MADEEEDVSYGKHPALRNFSRFGFMAKHVMKGMLKWGLVGAVAGIGLVVGASIMGIASGGIIAPILFLAAHLPIIGDLIKAGGAEIGSTLLSAGGWAAAGGGILGAVIGGIVAMSSASEAADAEEDRLVAKYEQQQARKERMIALERRRDEQRYAMERQAEMMRGPSRQQVPYGRPRQPGPQQGQGPGYYT